MRRSRDWHVSDKCVVRRRDEKRGAYNDGGVPLLGFGVVIELRAANGACADLSFIMGR